MPKKESYNFVLTDVFEAELINLVNQKLIAYVDTASANGLETTAESTDVRGGIGNQKLLTFKHSKNTNLTMTLPTIDFNLLSFVNGEELKKAKMGYATDTYTTDAKGEIILKHENIVDGTLRIWEKLEGRGIGSEFKGATITDGKVSLGADHANIGLHVSYDYTFPENSGAITMKNLSDHFPGNVAIRAKTLVRRLSDGAQVVANLYIPNATPDPQNNLSVQGGEAGTIELTFNLNSYANANGSNEYYELTIDPDATEDNLIGSGLESATPSDITVTP